MDNLEWIKFECIDGNVNNVAKAIDQALGRAIYYNYYATTKSVADDIYGIAMYMAFTCGSEFYYKELVAAVDKFGEVHGLTLTDKWKDRIGWDKAGDVK